MFAYGQAIIGCAETKKIYSYNSKIFKDTIKSSCTILSAMVVVGFADPDKRPNAKTLQNNIYKLGLLNSAL